MRKPLTAVSPLLLGCVLGIGLTTSRCAYHGPQVEAMLPKGQEAWLQGTVETPASAGIDHLVVYGDSLSDPGNLSRNTLGFVIPHTLFYRGRFSNGPVWADYVEKALNWSVENYAVGGALTREGGLLERWVVTSLPAQIDKSLGRLKQLPPEQTLIAIWIGPNNYLLSGRDFQDAGGKPRESILRKGVARTISDIQKSILELRKLGFRRIAIGTMPELGGLHHDPKDSFNLSDETFFMATRLHNEALREMIRELNARFKDQRLQLITYSAYDMNDETAKNPKAYGFSRLDAPCYVGSLTGSFYGKEEFCKDPMGYKFWEFIHPNTRMQCYYAAQFLADIAKEGLIKGYEKAKGVGRCLAIKNKG